MHGQMRRLSTAIDKEIEMKLFINRAGVVFTVYAVLLFIFIKLAEPLSRKEVYGIFIVTFGVVCFVAWLTSSKKDGL